MLKKLFSYLLETFTMYCNEPLFEKPVFCCSFILNFGKNQPYLDMLNVLRWRNFWPNQFFEIKATTKNSMIELWLN